MSINDHPVHGHTLAGKVALVSGSSSGIGAAVVRELSARGAAVVINYPFPEAREAAEKTLQSLKSPAKAVIIETDLSTETGPQKLVELTVREFGHIDILVNNAAVAATMPIDEPDDRKVLGLWDSIINLNGRGTMLLTRASLPHLSPQHSRIVNISSTTSRDPESCMTMYAGTKSMIESFTRCWAKDLPRKYGCTVNAVAPGPIATEMMLASPPEFLEPIKAASAKTPVAGRLGLPEEVAWAVAMFCEPGSSWMNGVYLPVTGGGYMG